MESTSACIPVSETYNKTGQDYSGKTIPVMVICFLLILLLGLPTKLQGQEIGHFAPGVFGIRDFIAPEPGYYGAIYTYRYTTTRLNDANGDQISSVTIGPGNGMGVTLDVDVDVAVGVVAPTFIWVSPWKVLGGSYGAYISPTLSNTSIGASLTVIGGSGRSAEVSQFGFGDLFIQPVWLTWNKEHAAFSAAYGLYIPTGKYVIETIDLPGVGAVQSAAADNIGLGFWTHQFQGAASYFPWSDQRMSITGALTYELHGKKEGFDIKPGQNLALNWGVSQYLPLSQDQVLLLEIGPAGYFSWQVTEDAGTEVVKPTVKDSVNGIGGQVGITQAAWGAVLNFHYFYEFSAKDRFQGESIGLNLAIKF